MRAMPFLTLNLDQALPEWWTPTFGNRAFEFDAFITHNAEDIHAAKLASALADRGVKLWHDGDADLRDRRVLKSVSTALVRSRAVLVCISDSFRDSLWCRAEYLPSLAVETVASAPRVIVTRMSPAKESPEALKDVRQFESFEFAVLAAFLKDLNCLTFIDSTRRTLDTAQQEIRAAQRLIADSAETTGHREVDMAVELLHRDWREDSREGAMVLMAMRQTLVESWDKLTPRLKHEVPLRATRLCELEDSDARANGLYILLHAASQSWGGALTTWTLSLVASEADSSVVHLVFPYMEGAWPHLNREQRDLLELCVLRDPIHIKLYYSNRSFVRELSPAVRMRIFANGLEPDYLSPPERFHLIESHVAFLMEQSAPISLKEPYDKVRAVMKISDMEIAMRELNALLFERSGVPSPYAKHLAGEVLTLFERISNERPSLWIAMADGVADFVLIPLLYCSGISDCEERSTSIYLRICDILERYKAVPMADANRYRLALERAEKFTDRSAATSLLVLADIPRM